MINQNNNNNFSSDPLWFIRKPLDQAYGGSIYPYNQSVNAYSIRDNTPKKDNYTPENSKNNPNIALFGFLTSLALFAAYKFSQGKNSVQDGLAGFKNTIINSFK